MQVSQSVSFILLHISATQQKKGYAWKPLSKEGSHWTEGVVINEQGIGFCDKKLYS